MSSPTWWRVPIFSSAGAENMFRRTTFVPAGCIYHIQQESSCITLKYKNTFQGGSRTTITHRFHDPDSSWVSLAGKSRAPLLGNKEEEGTNNDFSNSSHFGDLHSSLVPGSLRSFCFKCSVSRDWFQSYTLFLWWLPDVIYREQFWLCATVFHSRIGVYFTLVCCIIVILKYFMYFHVYTTLRGWEELTCSQTFSTAVARKASKEPPHWSTQHVWFQWK